MLYCNRLQGLYMHIKVAKRGVLRLPPNTRHQKFSLFTGKCVLVENTTFIVKETLQPVFAILLIEEWCPFAYEPLGNALKVEPEIVRKQESSHDAIAFLLNLFIPRGAQVSCQL